MQQDLGIWLPGLTDSSTQVIVEATGVHHRQLRKRLSEAGVALSVANLRQTLRYAKIQQRRNKTDKVGAVLSAQSGRERELPPSPQLCPIVYGALVSAKSFSTPPLPDMYHGIYRSR
jgi:hypothetical protein